MVFSPGNGHVKQWNQQCHSSQPMASPGRTPQRPNQSSWVKVTVTDKASWDGLKDVASREIMKSIERKEN